MIPRPPEITPEEWEWRLSPENYFMDGEISRAMADTLFLGWVDNLVRTRRKK